jgi:type II secretory pathway predicted ATPase ExeA
MYGQGEADPIRINGAVWCKKSLDGRSKEVQRIVRCISRGQSISVVGPSGSGKTWLLDHIAEAGVLDEYGICAAEHVFLRLSGRAFAQVDQPTCLGEFCTELLAQLKQSSDALREQLTAVEAEVGLEGHRGLRTLFRTARDGGLRAILILDDFDDLAQNDSLNDNFFAALRSLATGYEVIYLVASRRPLYELEKARPEASTLCGICQQFVLRPLAEPEACAAV